MLMPRWHNLVLRGIANPVSLVDSPVQIRAAAFLKMVKKWWIVVFLLLLPIAMAQEWPYTSEEVQIRMNISSVSTVLPTNPVSSLEYLIVNLSFLPLEREGQHILNLQTTPEAAVEDGYGVFRWDRPEAEELPFRAETEVSIQNIYPLVTEKIPFPLREIPDSLKAYTLPSATIDSDNEEIIRLASQLAEGEDDLYEVVHTLGVWAKTNIEYDLSTLTADISQKASWVLQTRTGVCDELTNLFIALNRALGIPARFVSGISYTNSPEFPEQWGSHGWAEVWFPGYGWIPFDVTYGELGFADPTHIKTKEGVDGDVASVSYSWLGRNVDIGTRKLDIQTSLQGYSGYMDPVAEISVKPVKESAAFGSYNLIEANLRNLRPGYTSVPVFLSLPQEVEIIGEREKIVLLGPLERKTVYWMVKVKDSLQRRYRYTFPFTASTLHNSTAEDAFSSGRDDVFFSRNEMESLLSQREKEEQKTYSKEVEMDCAIGKEEFYVYENTSISCTLRNNGNIFLENLQVCLENCETITLGISQSRYLEFNISEKKVGRQEARILLENKDISKIVDIGFARWDEPAINVTEFSYPGKVDFEDVFDISFSLDKASVSPPKNVRIVLDQGPFRKVWEIDELNDRQSFVLALNANDLGHTRNLLALRASFEDGNGRAYDYEKTFGIEVKDPTLGQRMRMGINQVEGVLQNLTVTGIVVLLIVISAIFVAIIRFVFKPARPRKDI